LAAKFQSIAEGAWGANSTVVAPFELCDNLLSDPMIGIPMIWPHSACRRNSWHTSIDSLDVVNYKFIEEMARVISRFLLTIADSDLKRPARDTPARITPRRRKSHKPLERIPLRRTIGPISLDPVPVSMWPADITDSPRWWCWQTRALWCADGRRNLNTI